jgi:hypothetical protein
MCRFNEGLSSLTRGLRRGVIRGERAVLKLMFGALIRAADRWRSVKVSEFERRQLAAVRKGSSGIRGHGRPRCKAPQRTEIPQKKIQQLSDLTLMDHRTINGERAIMRARELNLYFS